MLSLTRQANAKSREPYNVLREQPQGGSLEPHPPLKVAIMSTTTLVLCIATRDIGRSLIGMLKKWEVQNLTLRTSWNAWEIKVKHKPSDIKLGSIMYV